MVGAFTLLAPTSFGLRENVMANLARNARDRAQVIWPGANIHARGRNWIRHQSPDNPERFMLDVGIGPMHYGADQEIDTNWVVSSGQWLWEMVHADYNAYINNGSYRYVDYATGEYVNLDVTALEWRNFEGATQNIQLVSVNPSALGDVITWDNLFGPGTQLQIEAQVARLAKKLNLSSDSSLPTPTIGGTNIQLVFRFRLQRSNGISIFVDGLEWNENSQLRTGNTVEFKLVSTGQTIWWFKIPVAYNSSSFINGTQVFKKSGANLFVEVEIPYSWLSTVSYPVTIDPTIDPLIATGANDGHCNDFGGYQNNYQYVEIVSDNTIITDRAWFRFTGVTLEGTVSVAYMTLKANNTVSTTTADIVVYANDADNPTAPTSDSDCLGRALTASHAHWTPGNWTIYDPKNTPSLVDVIQELIDSYTIDNEAIMIMTVCGDSVQQTPVIAYDQSSSDCATLHIEYSTAAGIALTATQVDANIHLSWVMP